MKILCFLAVGLLSVAARGQQPASPAGNPPAAANATPRTAVSVAEISDMIRQADDAAKAGTQYRPSPLLQADGLRAGLEYHDKAATTFAVHEHESELFVVLDGSGTLTMGGTPGNLTRNGTNVTAATAEGAIPHKLVKGDMILVPEGTPHAVTQVDGRLILMSMHIPHPAPAAATAPAGVK